MKVEEQPDGNFILELDPEDMEKYAVQIPMTPELQKMWDEMIEENKRLEDAGTPYWCIHKDRDVTHPQAQWKNDGYMRPDGIEMQYKHGVICLDCWGYIQEG
jgi:hypothetical protein